MKNIKVKSCESCPFFLVSDSWDFSCKVDSAITFEDREKISEVNEKCPLKKEGVQVTLHVERPTIFLLHAKKPNFGFGEKIILNNDNYGMVAVAFTDESTDMTNTDMILEWMFERTQNIESSWTDNKYKNGINRISPLGKKFRSTSVGDVVIIKSGDNNTYWRCENMGWEEVDPIEYTCSGCGEEIFPNDIHFEYNKNCNCE